MAKKDLRAQMDAARAAAAFIGAAQEAESRTADREEAEADAAGAAAAGAAEEVPAGSRAAAAVVVPASAVKDDGPLAADGAAGAAVGAKDASRAKRAARQAKGTASDGTTGTGAPDFKEGVPTASTEELLGASEAASDAMVTDVVAKGTVSATEAPSGRGTTAAARPKATRTRKPRKKAEAAAEAEEGEGANARMTAQVLVPMTAEQREHADLLAQVMKVTRAEVMRQALDEYWDNHKADLQAAVAAYEQLIRKLMK